MTALEFWKLTHNSPFHFPLNEDIWKQSMFADTDSDGRSLFENMTLRYASGDEPIDAMHDGMISYGKTAFGFDDQGIISDKIHYSIIRDLVFPADAPEIGQSLLDTAMNHFGSESRVYAFFHYFGMSACARHGKLHESQKHVHDLLLENGYLVEHENIYYSRILSQPEDSVPIKLVWIEINAGSCREFAAVVDGREVCWGQVHFLPLGSIAYLRWIYVDEAFQHKGIGTNVMRALFSDLYEMGITRFDTDTARSNAAARSYYEKCGFTNEGITRSYFTK